MDSSTLSLLPRLLPVKTVRPMFRARAEEGSCEHSRCYIPSERSTADLGSSSIARLLSSVPVSSCRMQQDPGTVHAMNVCASIWDTGFQKGKYSDIVVQAR